MNYETLIGDFDGQIQKLLAENAALKEQVAQLDSFRNETLRRSKHVTTNEVKH